MDDSAVKVSVPRSRVVTTSSKDDKHFFGVLQGTRTYAELQAAVRAKFKQPARFQDMLATYLQVVSNRVEEVAPQLTDDQHIHFVEWVLLQGRDTVQALLDEPDFEAQPRWRTPQGVLQGAQGHWYQAHNAKK